MATLTFYRQARYDGGIRTGVDIDGYPLLEKYTPGDVEEDPTLAWFMDLRFEGDDLPVRPEEAREWLSARSDDVQRCLREASAKLVIGMDKDWQPLLLEMSFDEAVGNGHVPLTIACSTSNRIEARAMPDRLRELAGTFDLQLRELPEAQAVSQ
ncbi:MAG: hypothetical protein HY000_33795 [Planctomycetes bacterium]|nr:hypothetical protein [Planctomycetota bacterium]